MQSSMQFNKSIYFQKTSTLRLVHVDELQNIGCMTGNDTNYNFEQGQVMCMSRLEETVNDADFIFEAVKEDMEIKKDLLESKYQQC